MGDTVACWKAALERVEEYDAANAAPPSRIRKIRQVLIDRKVACLAPMHFAGYALDPLRIDVSVYNDHEIMEGLRATLRAMSSRSPWGDEGSTLALNDFMKYKARQGNFGTRDFDTKAIQMPAYSFWLMYGSGLQYLQWFAVRILAMVSGAAAPERFFSKLKWLKTLRRGGLSHKTTDMLTRMHYNMKLLDRAKKLDVVCARPRNTLHESLLEDMLKEVAIEDEDVDDDDDMHMDVSDAMVSESEGWDEEEEGPASPE